MLFDEPIKPHDVELSIDFSCKYNVKLRIYCLFEDLVNTQTGLQSWLKSLFDFNISKSEMKKFLGLSTIMFCVLFNYTILRDIKDVLINTTAGPEVVPYIKGIFVVFSSFVFLLVYSKLAISIGSRKTFYYIVSFFLLFFFAFGFFLYPHSDAIHPSKEWVESMQIAYPGLRFVVAVFGVWSYALFYVLAETWGSIVMSVIFWQFSNEIVTPDESKRFYPLFGIVSNFALICSGAVIKILANLDSGGQDPWLNTLRYLSVALVAIGIVQIIVHRWVVVTIVNPQEALGLKADGKPKKKKVKLSLSDSFKHLFKSKYLGLLAILVLAYGMSINLIEIVWKKQLALRFAGDQNGYAIFMGGVSQYTGVFVIAFIFLTKGVLNKATWFTKAMITPLVLLVTGVAFLVFVLCKDSDFVNGLLLTFGTSAVVVASYIGGFQNVVTKGCKYAMFDPTKEMAYVPLDSDLKTTGKAAVDGVGGRLGKAGGSYLWMFLFAVLPVADIISCAPYVAVFLGIVVAVWLWSVKRLSIMYEDKLEEIGEGDLQTSK
jgi:AAA family ATP:ADP antiporter